jgi:hypothetical protein
VSSGSRSPTEARAAVADRLRAVLLDPVRAQDLDVVGRTDAAVLVPLFLDADGYSDGDTLGS